MVFADDGPLLALFLGAQANPIAFKVVHPFLLQRWILGPGIAVVINLRTGKILLRLRIEIQSRFQPGGVQCAAVHVVQKGQIGLKVGIKPNT